METSPESRKRRSKHVRREVFQRKKAAVGFVLLLVILCAASAWTAAAIAGNRAETEREELFTWSVHRAYSALDAYDASGSESDRLDAAAAFYAFAIMTREFCKDSPKAADYDLMKDSTYGIYSLLRSEPEFMWENIGSLLAALEYLNADPWDPNGYFALSSLYTAALSA